MTSRKWILTAAILWISVLSLQTGCLQEEYEFSIKTYGTANVVDYLPEYAARGFTLYQGVSAGQIGSQAFEAILVEAEALGVPVKLCPSVSGPHGGFPNELNVDIFEAEVEAILDWTESVSGAVKSISVNMELEPDLAHGFQDAWADRDFDRLVALAEGTLDRDRFLESVERYRQIVTDLQNRGYQVQITTFPFLLDDVRDGDADIEDVCNIPLSGIPWDMLAFCAYSTEYASLIGTFEPGPHFVYTYAKTARKLFGDGAVINVGVIRSDGRPAYDTPEELAADIAAAKAAGVRKIELFSFGGMLQYEDYDFADWADATLVEPKVPDRDPDILFARITARVIDFIFDFME